MQVDPIKPMLKGPAAKRLKLKPDELLSKVAFKFNLRRYNEGNMKTMDLKEFTTLLQHINVMGRGPPQIAQNVLQHISTHQRRERGESGDLRGREERGEERDERGRGNELNFTLSA